MLATQLTVLWGGLLVVAPAGLGQQLRADNSASVPNPKPIPLTAEARGDIFMARKMFREAIETYDQSDPKTAVVLNKLGIAYHQMTNFDLARKFYLQSMRSNPKYPEAINNLGTIYYAQKNYRKAISYYRKALVLAPKSASIHSNLGTAYFARKNYKLALDCYQTALSLDPEVFEHRNSHGVLLQERTVAERAKFHFFMAKTYARSGQTERALLYMRKALEEGFKEKSKFIEDSDFASLRTLPEFDELLKLEPRAL
jgi:tetratricopeptide (TPR) repeat protein